MTSIQAHVRCSWSLCSMLFAATVAWLPPAIGRAETQAPPNIVLIFADDQRADTIAALGNPIIKTPQLDRLVKQGLSFRRAYMQGGMHGATCVPSRAMLLSGQNLFHIDERLQRDRTWPEAFAAAGYTTFISGKWHNGDVSLVRCFQQIESVFTGGMTNPLHAPLRSLESGKLTRGQVAPKHACEVFTDRVVAFLQQQAERKPSEPTGAKPFFAYLPFDGPHDPHIVPDSFDVQYSPESIPLPANFMAEHPFDNGEMNVRDELLLPRPRNEADVRQMLADYYRYISFLDTQIGRVLDVIEGSPLAERTIVIFAADSGVARGSHGLIGKQNLYEHSIRVPLIISGPGIAANQQTDALCYLFDLLPTLGTRCGVPWQSETGAAPVAQDGIDLNEILENPATAGRSELVFAYRNIQQAYTDGRWKIIRYPQAERVQWFDLQTDPHELADLSAEPGQQTRLKQYEALMQTALEQSGWDSSKTTRQP